MDENYFDNITVPDNEEEEDAANDLTFGDIGDVKAGDEASDALWKPGHASLSSKIEAEKGIIQRSRLQAQLQNGSPTISKQPLQNLAHPSHQSPHGAFGQPPITTPQLQTSPQQHPLHSNPSLQPQLPHISEYERTMIAYQEQQTQLLLRRHQETVEHQFLEAQRAQQAGITFDRKKFDQHQNATRQMILNDHYSRVRQIQMLAWHQNQQLMQQNAAMVDPRTGNTSYPDGQLRASEASVFSQSPVMANGGSPYRERSNDIQGATNAKVPGDHGLIRPTQNYTQVHSPNATFVEKAARMVEIERQMAEAGLGPKKPGRQEYSQFNVLPAVVNEERKTQPRTNRRLESMTDRDQELVFRVHLRQLESSVVYKDDYYNSILRKKEKMGGQDIFSDIAERVQDMRIRSQQRSHGSISISIRSPKIGRGSDSTNHSLASSPPHSTQNMKALANALGTLQAWNPRAPRRVMDFNLLEKRESNEDAPQKSLREDERVHVRLEIEKGYDTIAMIHDIVRGESTEALDVHSRALLSSLHLSERVEESGESSVTLQSTRFFATMCIIEKGRRYLTVVIPLLDVYGRRRAMSAVFENLGMLVFASKKMSSNSENNSDSELFRLVAKMVQESDCHDCLHFLDAFSWSHVQHRDAFLTTFRSSIGSRVIFLCMQRISGGLLKNKFDEEEISRAKVEKFSDAFTACLQDIFDGCESVNRVWEVTASLDTLAKDAQKAKYRGELNRLLRSGAIPAPPTS